MSQMPCELQLSGYFTSVSADTYITLEKNKTLKPDYLNTCFLPLRAFLLLLLYVSQQPAVFELRNCISNTLIQYLYEAYASINIDNVSDFA